jgi:hypothetical protein
MKTAFLHDYLGLPSRNLTKAVNDGKAIMMPHSLKSRTWYETVFAKTKESKTKNPVAHPHKTTRTRNTN